MKEALSVNTIRNLDVSSDVDDNYHKRYVQILRDAQVVKESRLQEIASIEKHIMEARAKALAYEEREEDKRMKICDDPDSFGIPPGLNLQTSSIYVYHYYNFNFYSQSLLFILC